MAKNVSVDVADIQQARIERRTDGGHYIESTFYVEGDGIRQAKILTVAWEDLSSEEQTSFETLMAGLLSRAKVAEKV